MDLKKATKKYKNEIEILFAQRLKVKSKKNLFILSWMRVAMRFEKIINQNNAETKIKKKDFWYQKSINLCNLWGREREQDELSQQVNFKVEIFFTSSSSPSCLELFLFQFFFSPTIFPYTSFLFLLLFFSFLNCAPAQS